VQRVRQCGSSLQWCASSVGRKFFFYREVLRVSLIKFTFDLRLSVTRNCVRNYAYAYAGDLFRVTLTKNYGRKRKSLVMRKLRITLKLCVILCKHNYVSSKVLTPYSGV
jgi:hypothetical protein